MTSQALEQDADIQPAIRGEGVAVVVDTTARVYDLRGLAWNGQEFLKEFVGYLFLDLQNDGTNPIYYYFSGVNTNDLNEATIQAAGSTLARVAAVPKVLRAAQDAPVRLRLPRDLFLVVKSTGGTTTLRIFPSSKVDRRVP